jgi:hypothetical protein
MRPQKIENSTKFFNIFIGWILAYNYFQQIKCSLNELFRAFAFLASKTLGSPSSGGDSPTEYFCSRYFL